MNKYNKGKIYKITSSNSQDIYVGSTAQKYLSSRFSIHLYDYKKYLKNEFPYMTVFDIIKLGNCKIELIELYNCNNKIELELREKFYIKTLPNVINKYIPTRTIKEWRQENKEDQKIKQQKWRDDNIDHVKEKAHEDYLKNKDKYKNNAKINRLKNKDSINIRLNEKIICECGQEIKRKSKSSHIKTKIHINHNKV